MSLNPPSRSLVSQADQSMVRSAEVPRSKFSGSWTRKTTLNGGFLIPFMWDEIYPGDHMRYEVTAYLRMQTMLFPMFDNVRVDTHFFFVPNRLVWANWPKFMGEQANPGDSIAFVVPQVVSSAGGFAINSVYDQFALPCVGQVTAGQTISVSALPLRAYGQIYDKWFRDENNIASAGMLSTADGPDAEANYVLVRRAKSHDYFTSALPWAQKFTVANVPLVGTAPITGIGTLSGLFPVANPVAVETDGVVSPAGQYARTETALQWVIKGSGAGPAAVPQIYANLSAASASMAINSLRLAWQMQALVERDARGGTRYTEIVKSHFSVTSADARLQRPEYIGGGSSPLPITPIAQTATGGGGVGALGAAGAGAGQHKADYAATEHGIIIGLISVRTELSYQQGINRMWKRTTRYDYYWPALATIGEQAVLQQEIYATGVAAADTTVFGYQERYQELRTRYSEVTGLFRSTSAGTIDPWHLSQRFLAAPVLGATFINDTPPMARVYAAGAATNFMEYLADIHIRREATRPIPMFGTPSALGRF